MFHHRTQQEHKRVWAGEFKVLTYFTQVQKIASQIRRLAFFFHSVLRLYASRSEHKYKYGRQEQYFSMTLSAHTRIMLNSFISLLPSHRMYATKRHREGEIQTISYRTITYATDNKFQYLNYNLRGEKNKFRRHKEKTRKKSAGNEILRFIVWVELNFLFAHRIAFRRHSAAHCCWGEGRIGHKLSMRVNADCNINARKFKFSLSMMRPAFIKAISHA